MEARACAARCAAAPDRYASQHWFRELDAFAEQTTPPIRPSETTVLTHPLARGVAALRTGYDAVPRTLACPRDDWTTAALEAALDVGIELVSSYSTAFRLGDRFVWSQAVNAPYLDQPDTAMIARCLPVVACFHDKEPEKP